MGSEYNVVSDGALPDKERMEFWRDLGVHFNYTLNRMDGARKTKEEL